MTGRLLLSFLLLLSTFAYTLAEVTILTNTDTIYDKSPKIRIRGAGFDRNAEEIVIKLGASGTSPLIMNKDFMITKEEGQEGIVLKLMQQRKWVDLTSRTPPVALILSSVAFKQDPDTNLLPNAEAKIIAQVLRTPTVLENTDRILFQTASNVLVVNGTGWIGAKKVDLYFEPSLFKEVAYEDTTKYPLIRDQVTLKLRQGYKWREEVGELKVKGVDTGGGPVKQLDKFGEEGVVVAMVEDDLEAHGVKVANTAATQHIYWDSPIVSITGEGFSTLGNKIRFSNGLLGNNVNYTTPSSSETKITLQLKQGSKWRANVANLPGYLTVTAIDAGGGYISAGPINSQKGQDVAIVFERPFIAPSDPVKKLFGTHTHRLILKGGGFPTDFVDFKFEFDPPLQENIDYLVEVVDRTEVEISLIPGRAWRSDPGPLKVTRMNGLGTENGWIEVGDGGMVVADVLSDIGKDQTGGITIFASSTPVYQAALRQNIVVTGDGFSSGDFDLSFEPPLEKDTDYSLTVNSNTKLTLTLKADRKWSSTAGDLLVKKVTTNSDKKEYDLAGGEGVRVAKILGDPMVAPGQESIHESQSKVITIYGYGFTSLEKVKVTIRPTPPTGYKVIGVTSGTIRVQLATNKAWLPSFMSLKDEDKFKDIPLQLTSIDTGAGLIDFENPITIAKVIKDREGVTCDDSCEFSFDGVCDDGSAPKDFSYYGLYGYLDDDYGGWYSEYTDHKDSVESQTYDYDDYLAYYSGSSVSACVQGTDCTDCGGVDKLVELDKAPDDGSNTPVCDNSCMYPRDGICDDTRGTRYCALGTDCQDCGPVGSANFSRSDDDGWWDDDDDYWTFNDGNFLDQAKGLESNRDKVRSYQLDEEETTAEMFLTVLEAMVWTVGSIFVVIALILLNKWYKGESLPFINAFNPEISRGDFELVPTQRMPITPDVTHT